MKPADQKMLVRMARLPPELLREPFREQQGAICYREGDDGRPEVLLVTSRDTGRWVIPKGWPMKGKKAHRAAEIEAREEAGVRGKASKKPVGNYTYLKGMPDGSHVPCVVRVHLLRVRDLEERFRETGQRCRDWVSFDEASRRVREPELKTLLVNLPALLAMSDKPAKTSGPDRETGDNVARRT